MSPRPNPAGAIVQPGAFTALWGGLLAVAVALAVFLGAPWLARPAPSLPVQATNLGGLAPAQAPSGQGSASMPLQPTQAPQAGTEHLGQELAQRSNSSDTGMGAVPDKPPSPVPSQPAMSRERPVGSVVTTGLDSLPVGGWILAPDNLEDCLRLSVILALSLLSCAHHEPPETESARTQRIQVKEEGTKAGKPYVELAFRPFPRDATLEHFSKEEAWAFVKVMNEAFGRKEGRSHLWVSHPQMPSGPLAEAYLGDMEQWRGILEEYEALYGPPSEPLPEMLPEDRFATAFMLSTMHMPAGVRAGAQELFSSRTAIMAIVVAGLTYLTLWLAPEPVFTKSTATAITIALMAVYGVLEIINISRAFMRLYDEVSAATTLAELEAAAKRFGEAMGQAGVRIMTMVAGGVASRAAPYASLQNLKSVFKMPATVAATTPQGQIVLVPVVEAAATVVDAAKGTAVLMGVRAVTTTAAATAAMASARTTGDCRPESNKGDAQRHHIATDKNRVSTDNGGPWTQRFEELFAKAGMSLEDPANIIYIVAHQGPHPEAYHRQVYTRLSAAVSVCDGREDCRRRLTTALNVIAANICKRGSELNSLLVR